MGKYKMIKILESMKRSYLFFCFVVITVCRIYAADVTYIFSDAAAEKGIILDSEWTTDSIEIGRASCRERV